MKLLFCKNCRDLFALRIKVWRECVCGQTRGRYINEIDAEHYGGVRVGINNTSFRLSIIEQEMEDDNQPVPIPCEGVRFEAFIIPKMSSTCSMVELKR